MTPFNAPVAIVGGGPVGIALALFLDKAGIRTVLFNSEGQSRWHPKGSTHNARTMEHYRWIGVADEIRSLGIPKTFPKDIAYFTRCNAWEIVRFKKPSEVESSERAKHSPVIHQVPEPLFRCNQMYVERYLLDHAATRDQITLRFGWEVSDLVEEEEGVTLFATCLATGMTETWRSSFAVGCDGANSFVRRKLGIAYDGLSSEETAFLQGSMVSSYVKIPTLVRDVMAGRESWMYNVVARDSRMLLVTLDGAEDYLLMHKGEYKGHVPSESEVVDIIHSGVGCKLPVKVIRSVPWTGGIALIANSFRKGKVFLCGDACHLFSPTGGYGMNTGIDDARNLSWKLAACVQGWAPETLLSTYEAERKPIAIRNTRAARLLTDMIGEIDIPEKLEEDTPNGDVIRQNLGAELEKLRYQFGALGAELGARYDHSSIVICESAPPKDRLYSYIPSTKPGGRLPHMWLDKLQGQFEEEDLPTRRVSIFDVLGLGFTLLAVGKRDCDVSDFVDAAVKLKVPLEVVRLEEPQAKALYGSRLILVRPDHHIAWTGSSPPRLPETILRKCIGYSESDNRTASCQRPNLSESECQDHS